MQKLPDKYSEADILAQDNKLTGNNAMNREIFRSTCQRKLKEYIYEFETPVISHLQSIMHNSLLNFIFARIFTFLGTHTMFLIGLPPLFWISDGWVARHLVWVLGEGVIASSILKDWFCSPRPLSEDEAQKETGKPGVKRLLHVKKSYHTWEYGLPSTHSTNSTTLALFLLLFCIEWNLKNWIPISLILTYAIFLPLSRVYCGMHSFLDITVGAITGAAIVITHWALFMSGLILPTIESLMFNVSGVDRDYMNITMGGLSGEIWIPRFLGLFLPLVLIIYIFLFKAHPDPNDPCPCYDDAVCNAGVILGVFIGTYCHFRTKYEAESNVVDKNTLISTSDDPLTLAWKFDARSTPNFNYNESEITTLTLYGVLGRILFGTLVILVWRSIAKLAMKSLFEGIYKHYCWPLYSGIGPMSRQNSLDSRIIASSVINGDLTTEKAGIDTESKSDSSVDESMMDSAVYIEEDDSNNDPNDQIDEGVAFSSAISSEKPRVRKNPVIMKADSKKTKFESLPAIWAPSHAHCRFTIHRYSLEMVTKWVVYSGIGWITVQLVPNLFKLIGI